MRLSNAHAPRRRVAGALAVLAVAICGPAALTTPAQAGPLPASYSASATGDVLRVSSAVVGAELAAVDLVRSRAAADSASGTTPSTATSANVGASVAGVSGAAAHTVTAPPSSTQSGTLGAATLPGVLDSGLISYTDTANWAGTLACVPTGTPLSRAVTRSAGASATFLGVQVVDTGDATTTSTTSLEVLSPVKDTRAVTAAATADVAGASLLNGLVTLSALRPTLTATATSGPATAATLTADAVTVTGPLGTQTLTAGGSVTVAVPLVGSVTLTMASNASVVDDGGGSFSTDLITADVTLLGGTGAVTVDLLPLTVSAVAPAGGVQCTLPVITITTPADGSTTTDTTPVISGTSNVPNGVVTVVVGGESHTAPTDANGSWSLTWPTPLPGGLQTAQASVSKGPDTATDSTSFTVLTAPSIAISTPADGSKTADTTPAITGSSSVIDGTISLVIDGGTSVTVPTDGVGGWTYTPPSPLAEGPHTVAATATTPGGTATDTSSFIVAVLPAVHIDTPADGSVTHDRTPTIRGTSSVVDGSITLSIDGQARVTVLTDANGDWSYVPTTALADGTHHVVASAADAEGNTATDRVQFEVVADGQAPAIDITTATDGSTTTDRTPEITGTSDVLNGTVDVTINDDPTQTVATDGRGNWSLTPETDLPCGQNTVRATATNQFGTTVAESAFTIWCPATPAAGRPATLAHTGADLRTLAALGILLLLGGAALTRRVQRTTKHAR